MHKRTNPQQKLFDIDTQISNSLCKHLKTSWADFFKVGILTDYEVHGAGRSDIAKAIPVIERLNEAWIKPEALFADGGYPSVPSTFKIIEQQIEFIMPVNRGPIAGEVIGSDKFQFDSNGKVTQCPMGHKPVDHRVLSAHNTTGRTLHSIFDGDTCRPCFMLDQCPVRAPNHRERCCQGHRTPSATSDWRYRLNCG
jgi:hypothetical protein